MGRTIAPKVIGRKETHEVNVPPEMLRIAQDQCRPLMRDLVDGHPLTNVLIKAYMQEFIDCYEAGKGSEGGDDE